jgi:hypothetical protein
VLSANSAGLSNAQGNIIVCTGTLLTRQSIINGVLTIGIDIGTTGIGLLVTRPGWMRGYGGVPVVNKLRSVNESFII